jgi:hypothetical protein
MSDDDDRLERYLEWQRARDNDRAARRLRWIGGTVVGAGGAAIMGAGLAVWLLILSPHSPDRSAGRKVPAVPTEVAAPPPSVTEQSRLARAEPSPVSPRPEPRAQGRGVQSSARQAPVTSGSHAPKYTERAAPAPAPATPRSSRPSATAQSEQPKSEDVVAVIARTQPPASVTPMRRRSVAPESSVGVAPTAAPDSPLTALKANWDTPRASRTDEPPSPPTRTTLEAAPRRTSDRVVAWLKDQIQEFRTGVKREIDDLRSGYDKVREGVRQLPSKIPADERGLGAASAGHTGRDVDKNGQSP